MSELRSDEVTVLAHHIDNADGISVAHFYWPGERLEEQANYSIRIDSFTVVVLSKLIPVRPQTIIAEGIISAETTNRLLELVGLDVTTAIHDVKHSSITSVRTNLDARNRFALAQLQLDDNETPPGIRRTVFNMLEEHEHSLSHT